MQPAFTTRAKSIHTLHTKSSELHLNHNGPFAASGHMVHWDIQNKATSSRQICIFFVVDVPVRSLLSSMVDFVPCDR